PKVPDEIEPVRFPSPGGANNTVQGPAGQPVETGSAEPQEPGTTSIPLKPEPVAPAPPPPSEDFYKTQPPASRLTVERVKSHRTPAAKLTEPAPPIALLEQKVAELIALQGQHPGQDLIADIM